jgi:hypothetical protein
VRSTNTEKVEHSRLGFEDGATADGTDLD